MERFDTAGSQPSFGFGETRGQVRARGVGRALTLFTYSALGWALLVGGFFLFASAL